MLSILHSIAESFSNNLIAENRYQMILDGLQVTLLITFCAADRCRPQVKNIIEETTTRGFRVKLIL